MFFIARQHAMQAQRDIVMASPSVRLSVHYTLVFYLITNSNIGKLFPSSGRGMTLAFWALSPLLIPRETPHWRR